MRVDRVRSECQFLEDMVEEAREEGSKRQVELSGLVRMIVGKFARAATALRAERASYLKGMILVFQIENFHMDTTMLGNLQDATVCDGSICARSGRIKGRAISAAVKFDWFKLKLKKLCLIFFRLSNSKTLKETSQCEGDGILDGSDEMLIELIAMCHLIGCASD